MLAVFFPWSVYRPQVVPSDAQQQGALESSSEGHRDGRDWQQHLQQGFRDLEQIKKINDSVGYVGRLQPIHIDAYRTPSNHLQQKMVQEFSSQRWSMALGAGVATGLTLLCTQPEFRTMLGVLSGQFAGALVRTDRDVLKITAIAIFAVCITYGLTLLTWSMAHVSYDYILHRRLQTILDRAIARLDGAPLTLFQRVQADFLTVKMERLFSSSPAGKKAYQQFLHDLDRYMERLESKIERQILHLQYSSQQCFQQAALQFMEQVESRYSKCDSAQKLEALLPMLDQFPQQQQVVQDLFRRKMNLFAAEGHVERLISKWQQVLASSDVQTFVSQFLTLLRQEENTQAPYLQYSGLHQRLLEERQNFCRQLQERFRSELLNRLTKTQDSLDILRTSRMWKVWQEDGAAYPGFTEAHEHVKSFSQSLQEMEKWHQQRQHDCLHYQQSWLELFNQARDRMMGQPAAQLQRHAHSLLQAFERIEQEIDRLSDTDLRPIYRRLALQHMHRQEQQWLQGLSHLLQQMYAQPEARHGISSLGMDKWLATYWHEQASMRQLYTCLVDQCTQENLETVQQTMLISLVQVALLLSMLLRKYQRWSTSPDRDWLTHIINRMGACLGEEAKLDVGTFLRQWTSSCSEPSVLHVPPWLQGVQALHWLGTTPLPSSTQTTLESGTSPSALPTIVAESNGV